MNIIDEIDNKIHEFGTKHGGKYPKWIFLNPEHFNKIRAVKDYYRFVTFVNGKLYPTAIMGMHYIIKNITEIEVQ